MVDRTSRKPASAAAASAATEPVNAGGAAGRNSKRYAARREEIMAAAVRMFNTRGLKGATLADIAAAVGLATNSITYYFRKKEDIATACLLHAIEVYTVNAEQACEQPTISQRIERFFQDSGRMLAAIDAGESAPIVQFHDVRALTGPHAERVFAAYNRMFRSVRALLQDESTSHWPRADLNARAHIVLSAVLSMRSWIRRYDRTQYQLVGKRFADVLLHGIAAPGANWVDEGPEADWRLVEHLAGSSEAFFRAATVLVNEQGYRGASIDRIAARINLTKGSFYHHHDTKQDLIHECFARTFAVFRRSFDLADATGGSGWDRACMAMRALLRFQLSEDGPLLRFSAYSALPDRNHRDEVRLDMLRVFERMNSLLVAGMMDGSIRALDPAVGAQVLVSVANAVAEIHLWVAQADEHGIGQLCGRTLVYGLLCEPASGTGGRKAEPNGRRRAQPRRKRSS